MKAYVLPFVFGALTFPLLDIIFSNRLIVCFWTFFIVFLIFGAVYLYRAREGKKTMFFLFSLVLLFVFALGAAFPHVLTRISQIFAFTIELRLSLFLAAVILLIILLFSSILSAVQMHETEKALYDDLIRRYSKKDMQMD